MLVSLNLKASKLPWRSLELGRVWRPGKMTVSVGQPRESSRSMLS